MTRIISGRAGGRTLVVPPGRETRPTSDRVREALFSRLDHEGLLDGTSVLDLYAGSGALGLEAASRGADRVVLVDSAKDAVAACRRNVASLDLGATVSVHQSAVTSFLRAAPASPYDLVLLDPPYPMPDDDVAEVLAALVDGGHLAPGAVVVVERSTRGPEPRWPAALTRFDRRRYGETTVWLAETGADHGPA